MNTLYWITVLSNLNTLLIALLIISAFFTCFGILSTVIVDNFDEKDSTAIKLRNWGLIILVPSFLGVLFTPSEKQLYMIYGVGGTLDYLKENPTAKELPDKCIKALDTWVDNFNKEADNIDIKE